MNLESVKSLLSLDPSAHAQNTALLRQLIMPLDAAKQEMNYQFKRALPGLESLGLEYGGFNLQPDYQRGHVWTIDQQTAYLENVLRGVIDTAGLLLKFNCPNWENHKYQGALPRGFECLDGLQRLTAVIKFCEGEVRPFGLSVEDLAYSSFSVTNFHFRVAFYDFQTRADVLRHYLAFNGGGVVHSKDELDRVKGLLLEAIERGE
ncbi:MULTISPECIES: DUF262 domain-containing protein [Pseudomonas]|jgi:hypothetical protein|uniref:DUF262 domain-containing protein n=1 Tax=Pseudomonas TaxID=286 RepID=UPI000C7B73B9|nr:MULTISPECIES: DUF262 domain-containing protein [Pseudomonas]MDH1929025.1 DUF262 domain-containing protein [Pseudomonas sp. GD03696]PLP92246.1 hypothetical protein CX682_09890 [Pseudomonas sp. FFUP_PS_41]QDQ70404.1 hypothetical protein pJBCL41_00030 [Pseudomonas sp.]QIZ23138.1 Hypothetical protein [Pseudomonas putida]WBM35681.1 DUF262 domain-containing protein [Pseudomonas sp. NY11382]